jgi:hypothetical protein
MNAVNLYRALTPIVLILNQRIVDELLTPLFGTGNISLTDDNEHHPFTASTTSNDIDVEIGQQQQQQQQQQLPQQQTSTGNAKNYGSILPIGNKTNNNNNNHNKKIPNDNHNTNTSSVVTSKDDRSNNNATTNQKEVITNDTITEIDRIMMMTKPHRPTYNPCLYMFHLLEGIAIIASIALIVTQIIPIVEVFLFNSNNNNHNIQNISSTSSSSSSKTMILTGDILNYALRFYISLFCGLFIMTELGTSIVYHTLPLLQYYSSRGFLYSFLGLICSEEAYTVRVQEKISSNDVIQQHIGWTSIFMEVSSYCMLLIGIIYILLGLCCCKKVRDHYKMKELEEWKQYKIDLQKWKTSI